MITTEREYRVSKSALTDFEDALYYRRMHGDQEDPILHQALIESIESEIQVLHKQLSQYERIRAGNLAELRVQFEDLGEALTLARVVAGLTQKELAKRVGIKEQQIQRYEATDYESASFARLKEIVWALGSAIRLHVSMSNTTQAVESETPSPLLTA